MSFEPIYLLLLPAGVLIATAYTSTAISGANFWVPVYLLGLGFEPPVAFWLALLSMLFGSASGLTGHIRQGTVDVRAAGRMLALSAPAALAGAWLSGSTPGGVLSAAFGLFAITLGALILGGSLSRAETGEARPWTILGGLLTGLISVGIGAVLMPRLLGARDLGRPVRVVGTCLLVVFGTSLVATLGRLRGDLLAELGSAMPDIVGVMLFVAPGVILGGQIGPRLARRLDLAAMRRYAAILLIVIGLLMLARLATSI